MSQLNGEVVTYAKQLQMTVSKTPLNTSNPVPTPNGPGVFQNLNPYLSLRGLPPTMVTNVYRVKPIMRRTLVMEIQNSISPNHLTEYSWIRARAISVAVMQMAGCRLSVQYSTITLMAVNSKQTKASCATTN